MKDVSLCMRGNCVAVLAATAVFSFTPVYAQDECTDATEIYVGVNDFSTIGATDSSNPWPDGACDAFPGVMNEDIWLSFSPTVSGGYSFSTCNPSSFDTDLAVYGGDCEGLNQLACSGDGAGLAGCQVYYSYIPEVDLSAGSSYLVRIGSYADAISGDGTIEIEHLGESLPGACCISGICYDDVLESDCASNGGSYQGDGSVCDEGSCEASANDECSGAVEIVLGVNDFSTIGMTNSPDPWDPNCEAFGGIMNQDVWFTFYPTVSGSYSFSTCNASSFDTDLAVYDGDCEEMNQIACSGDGAGLAGCQIYYSYIPEVDLSAGSTYTVRIGGWNEVAFGTGTLEISSNLPGACCLADDCFDDVSEADCNATGGQWLGGDSTCEDGCPAGPADECGDAYSNEAFVGSNAFSTLGATDSADPIDGTNCAVLGVMNDDIWMVFNPPGDGNISLETCEADSFDTDLAVYTGDCEELVQVACDGDGAGLEGCQAYYSHIPSLDVLEGTTYYVRIGSWADGVQGTGVLEIAGDFDTEPECPADIDGSGSVDFADLLSVLSSWGPCSGACPADLDGNGSVDFGDLLAILSVWGPCE